MKCNTCIFREDCNDDDREEAAVKDYWCHESDTMIVHCKKAPYDVYIGRPSMWGNPYRIGQDGTREEVIAKYEEHVRSSKILMRAIPTLAGKTLGCWCPPKPCHGDVLIKLLKELEEDKC